MKRFNAFVCHRRFGKTVLCVNYAIIEAYRSKKLKPRFAYVAPFLSQAKDIAWNYVKEYGLGFLPQWRAKRSCGSICRTGRESGFTAPTIRTGYGASISTGWCSTNMPTWSPGSGRR